MQLAYLQNTFDGGLNQQVDGSRVAANEYPLLINGRHRNDVIEQVNTPIDRTPDGILRVQGLYAAGSFSVLFADGAAFYKDESVSDSNYTRIAEFTMGSTQPVIYACAVPASTVNSARKLALASSITSGVVLLGNGTSTPQALVVQDGVKQPWVIFPDGTARQLGVYNNWTQTNREYVPVGRQMLHHDGILYIVSPDGSQVFRSVTGRPLDFMVIIDTNGDKLPKEADGGAANVSFKVDYAPITAIGPLSSPDGSFYVSTARTSYAVTPDVTETVYGEPQFTNTFLFTTGAVNNFSVCDILGDTAIIDFSGIRSFNSVAQFRFEGKNSPFSARVTGLLGNLKQTATAAITHDNYAMFYVNTVFGSGIMVFDTTTGRWASLDLLSPLTSQAVLMFCEIKTTVNRKLLCVTASKVYELYPTTGNPELIGYYSPEFNSNDPKISQKATYLHLGFVNVTEAGSVFVQPVADGKIGTQKVARVRGVSNDNPVRRVPPVTHGDKDSVRTITIPLLDTAKACWKFGVFVRWNLRGSLNTVRLMANSEETIVSIEEQSVSGGDDIVITTVVGSVYITNGSIIDVFGKGLGCVDKITVNQRVITDFAYISDSWVRLSLPSNWTGGPLLLTITAHSCGGSVYSWGLAGASTGNPVDNIDNGDLLSNEEINPNPEDPDHTEHIIIEFPRLPQDPPPPASLCSANTAFSPTSLKLIDMSGSGQPDAYIMDLTSLIPQPTNIKFAGLYFNKNADGSWTFVTPLIQANGYSLTNKNEDTALNLIGNSYNSTSGVIPFVFGGLSFCVNFGGGTEEPVIPPPPLPPDPPIFGCDACGFSLVRISGYPTEGSPSGDHDFAYWAFTQASPGECRWISSDYGCYCYIYALSVGTWRVEAGCSNETDTWSAVFTFSAPVSMECPVGNPAGTYSNGVGTCLVF